MTSQANFLALHWPGRGVQHLPGVNHFVGNEILQKLDGTVQGHGLDGLGGLPGALEVDHEIGPLPLTDLVEFYQAYSIATFVFCKKRFN